MNGLQHKAFAAQFEFEEKAHADGRIGRIKGYGLTFGNVDNGRDRVVPGAVDEWIAELTATGKRIKMTDTHGEVIGDFDVAVVHEKGLWLEGEPLAGVQAAEETMIKARAGVYDSMSIGYRIKAGGFEYVEDNVRELTKISVHETAILAFPMNDQATIAEAKGEESKRAFEKRLRDVAGLSKRDAQALLARGWDGYAELRDAVHADPKGGEEFAASFDGALQSFKR